MTASSLKQIGRDNRERVRAYFLAHVGCTNIECAKALSLDRRSIWKHIKRLRQEWARD
jgi:biotin operon repressor